ncbi:hypothetical protein MKZ20_20225 [Psychrobacillus sp. FSL K6-2684]|uniref:hypothetical protein n=1 Tax=Psychrobacillus sp. FSL K6-2684 TaxID=2921547 RepID=UPI0030FB6353
MRFFKDLNGEFFEDKPYAYSNHVKAFNKYIEHKGITEDNLIVFLQGIRAKDIVDSLNYYIEKNNITSKDTALRYSSAIKEYLYYALDSGKVNNSELMKELELATFKESSYRYKMNNFIAKHELLKEREGFEIPSDEEVRELIKQCNSLLESDEEYLKAQNNQKYFNKFRSALIIKLILLTGVPYRTINSIKCTDLNINNSTILINSFEIRLPKILKLNFEKYMRLSNEINLNRDKLFIEFNGNSMSVQTAAVYGFMKSIIGRGDLNGVVKYTIIKMIEEGISERVIKQVTGVEDTIINDCHLKVYGDKKAIRHFDSKIRGLEIYDVL